MHDLNKATLARHNSVLLTVGPLLLSADAGMDESRETLVDMYWLIMESLCICVGDSLAMSERDIAERVEEIARRIASSEYKKGRLNI